MQLDFLASDTPLTKHYTRRADGSIEKTSYPNAWAFTSMREHAKDLASFLQVLKRHASDGHCLLKGLVSRPLVSESRAGSTDSYAPTNWLCLDFDGVDTKTPAEALSRLDLSTVSYVIQWSSSQGIYDKKLRCHIFIQLDQHLPAPVIKQWLTQLNLENPFLANQHRLSKTNMGVIWALDITACQNDKLIYIAPPVLHDLPNPLGARPRYALVERTKPTLHIDVAKLWSPERLRTETDALINRLREAQGLEPRKLVTREYKGEIVVAKPDQGMVTGVRHERGFVYLNLNGGDSWAYYHPDNNPEVIYNFKGEPNYATKELLPDYYSQARRTATNTKLEATQSLGAHSAGNDKPVLLAFRDKLTSRYYTGSYTPEDDSLELNQCNTEKQVRDWCMQVGMPMGDFIPVWELGFDPANPNRVDVDNYFINQFKKSPWMLAHNPKRKPAKPPAVIAKLVNHVLAGNVEVINHFYNWLAFIFQRLERPRTAWVIYGVEGTGKGMLVSKVLRPLMGTTQASFVPGNVLSEAYTKYMKNALMVVFDEAHLSEMKDVEGVHAKLRNFITEPTLMIREMYSNHVEMANYAAIMCLSNKPDVIRLQKDDRRWNVGPWQPEKLALTDHEIDDVLPTELQDFYDFLMAWPLDETKARTPLQSEDRDRLIHTTTSSADDVAAALDPRYATMSFFLDQLPSDDKRVLPLNLKMRLDEYKGVLHALITRAVERSTGRVNVSRDELHILFDYIVGGMPATPHKFTKFLAHRHIHTEKVRIGDRTPYGIGVAFKDYPHFDDYLREHWPAKSPAAKVKAAK